MRGKFVRLALKCVVIGAVCVVAGIGLVWGLYVGVNYWRVGRAIRGFERRPSQARADALVRLIDEHVPTAEQGERILELLLTPTIRTRKAYPLGSSPVMALELPSAVRFREARVGGKEQLLWDGAPVRAVRRGGNVVRGTPELLGPYPAPAKVGTYRMEVRRRRALYEDERGPAWTWRPWGGPFPRCLLPYRHSAVKAFGLPQKCYYACSVVVAADVVVVEESAAEKIEIKSDPSLDEAMRAALVCTMSSSKGKADSEASGKRGSAGWVRITYQDLPVAVGFEPVLVLSDGREIRGRGRLRARAGSSGRFAVSPSNFLITEMGSYTGSIVLRSDPDVAYEDPAIKTIWGGTLEFPVSFAFFPDPNGP